MKKIIVAALVVGAFQVFGTVTAFASTSTGYDSSSDTTVNVGSTSTTSSTSPSLGTTLFNVQEGIYQSLGLNVPHDYVWVNVNGTHFIALDPPKPMM